MFNKKPKLSPREKAAKATVIFQDAMTLLTESSEELNSEKKDNDLTIASLKEENKAIENVVAKNNRIITKLSEIIS